MYSIYRRNVRKKVQVYRATVRLMKDPKQDPESEPKRP